MADEFTDVTTIEELTSCCRVVESDVPEEHFIEILPLKKVNAESIYSALGKCCREKNIQLGGKPRDDISMQRKELLTSEICL